MEIENNEEDKRRKEDVNKGAVCTRVDECKGNIGRMSRLRMGEAA